jgi:hypothetical protein
VPGNDIRIRAFLEEHVSKGLRDIRTEFDKGAKTFAVGALGATAVAKGFDLVGDAASAVVGLLGDAKQSYAEDQVSQKQLDAALRANIPAWTGNKDAIEDVLLAREKLGFSDDEQRSSLASLVTRTHDATKALDLQRMAMDLARLRGIDLAAASDLVGKAYNGQVGALRRAGIAVDEHATAAEALLAVQKAVAGQAQQYASTDAGKEVAAQLRVGESMERLGKTVSELSAEVLPVLAEGFEKIVDLAEDVAEAAKPVTDGIGDVADTVGYALTQIGPFIDTVARARQSLDDLGDSIPFVAGGMDLLGKAVTLPLQPLFFLKDRFDDLGPASTDAAAVVSVSAQDIADDTRESSRITRQALGSIGDTATDAATETETASVKIQQAFTHMTSGLEADTKKVDDFYDVLISQDKLAAANSEINAQRRIIASATATDAEKADARVALHQLEADQSQMLEDLASHAATSSTAFQKAMDDINARLAKSQGKEREALEALKRALVLAVIQAKVLNNQLLTLDETIAGTLARGGYVSAAGASVQTRASGGPVEKGMPYLVNEDTPRSEIFIPDESGVIVPNPGGGGLRLPTAGASGWGGGGTASVTVHSHIHLDGRVIAEVVSEHLTAEFDRSSGTSVRQ